VLSGRTRLCSDWEDGWLHAKFAFRGSVMAVVTLVDHLQGVHIIVSNSLNFASEEKLPTWHPMRRLMAPFNYMAYGVNMNAAVLLVNEGGMISRATGLTAKGIRQVFEYGNTSSRHLAWLSIPERKRLKGVDTLTLPLDEDGDDYYAIIFNYVRSYMIEYYGPFEATKDGPVDLTQTTDACASDMTTVEWYKRVDLHTPNNDLPKPLTCHGLLNVLATAFYLVSAIHRHVGTIAAEVEDPCFAPWAWREGDLCGPPRTFTVHAEIMSATAYATLPKIVEDYTHLFEDEVAKELWRGFSANMTAFQDIVDARNVRRLASGKFAFKVYEPENIETSTGI